MVAAGSAVAATSIAVQFLGRDGSPDQTGNPGVPPIAPSDSTGVVPQTFWNPIDNQYGYAAANKGTTSPGQLLDSTGVSSPVILTFDCNDSWYNDVTPTNLTKPAAKMMNGIIKSSAGGGVPGVFTFTNVPEGQYDLYVYTDMNGDGVQAKFWDADGLTTYYVTLQHQFYDTNTFVLGSNTDPNNIPTNTCNYVKFSNLGTYGRGTIGVLGQWIKNSDGIGVAGIQLVNIGPPAVNPNPVSILKQPASRRVLVGDTNVTFSVSTKGPVFSYQWFTNGVAIPGATGSSVLAPPIASSDNGTKYSVVISNNVNVVTSSNAVITVGQLVQVAGVQEKLWYGATRSDVESGAQDNVTPSIQLVLSSFSSPEEQGDTFTERLNCLFKPSVTTNYTFFITSDDNSDLFVSTDSTPANKRMVAQETAWSNPFSWVTDDGGGSLSQKRSDRFVDPVTQASFSNGIPMVAGTSYYIEAVHNEGGGGDKVDVTFKIVGESDPVNGDLSRITAFTTAPYPMGLNGGYIVVTNFPPSLNATQSLTATLTIGATSGYVGDTSSASPGIAYQWQSAPAGSSTFANISGANGTSYTTPLLKLSDNGTQYRVALIAGDASTNSSVATLTVTPDTIPPRPVSITGVGATARTIVLTFDELMDKTSAETPSGYVFNPGNIVATNVSLGSDGMTVTIQTGTALPQNVTNVLTITGAKDLAGNLPAANTTISFSFQLLTYEADIRSDGPVAYFRFEEPIGTAVATNSGSSGIDGAYYTGDEASAGAGGVPSAASGDPGPQPPAFQGFPENNHAATFDGPAGTQRWVDAKAQYLQHRASFSLEYWVRPTNRVADPTAFGTRIGIVGQNDAIEYGFIDQNNIQIWTPNGGSLNTTYSFPDGEWHHVATIADGTSLKTYYDGVLKGTSSATTADYGNSAYNVHIGGSVFDGTGNYFTGNIDEVAIFTNSIPAARIAEHYSAGKIGGSIIVNVGVTPVLPSGNGPRLTFSRSGATLTISWSPAGGTLQTTSAFTSSTQWTDVGTANPATITIGPGKAFYRVKQ